jgi:arylsulfatase A-like enzyme
MMLLGRFGVRIHGSSCYDFYYSGAGVALAPRFVIPGLVAALGDNDLMLRAAAISSSTLLERFEHEMASAEGHPVFAYIHFLDLHGPYMAPGQEHDPLHIAEMRHYLTGCYARACDQSDSENARLIASARRSYDATLVDLDAYTARVEAVARHRGRPFQIVITADHGELFGEHGGFAHGGGFVPELLNVPFVVYDSRGAPEMQHRCELLSSGEALRATVTGAAYPDHPTLVLHSPPLGTATLDKAAGSLHYVIEDAMRVHSGTWRNIHREPVGDVTFPLSGCAK